jgi:transposase
MAKRSKSTFERLSGDRLNRKQRRELSRRIGAGDPSLSIVNPHAGGIDVGNESHFVAVPSDRDPSPVQEFGCWTADLVRMAEWLQSCRIDTDHGIRVVLVNARNTKNIPGRL